MSLGMKTLDEIIGLANSLSVPACDKSIGQEKGHVPMFPQWCPQIVSLIFTLLLRKDSKARDQTT